MKCKFCFFSCYKKKKENKKKKKISISREISIILKDKSELIKLDESIIKNPKLNNSSLFRGNDTSSNKRFTTTSKANEFTETVIIKNPSKSSTEINQTKTKKGNFIHEFKDKIRCFFCGGKNCKYENYLNNIKNNNAIIGLNSNYITDNLIASQRPSEILINKYNLVEQFKQHNIGLIINLEREGEHPFCGPNAYHLTPSGYSYNPSIFTGNEIICRFYGWKDMSTPSSLSFMIEIVKDITIMIREEKKNVLVHCHDGNGRSGVVIACYLIFNSHDTNVWDIIKNVRKHRINAIYTRAQEKFCKKFYDYVSHIRTLFNDKTPKEKIETFLRSQDEYLCGKEILDIGIVPILLKKCLRKILNISKKYNLNNVHIYQVIGEYSDSNLSIELNKILCVLKESINNSNWNLFYKTENLHIIIALLFQWLTDYVLFLICPQRTEKLIQNSHFIEIETYVNEKLGQIEELSKMIKNDFYCYEYETIYNIAKFARHFLPTNSLEENCYKQMLDSFSLRLLGYKMVDVYQKEIFNNIKKIVTGLSTIIEFMVISINLFKGNDDNNPFVIPQKKLSLRNKIQASSITRKYSKNYNESPSLVRLGNHFNSISLNINSKSNNISMQNSEKPTFSILSRNNFISQNDKSKELDRIPEKEKYSNMSKNSMSHTSDVNF